MAPQRDHQKLLPLAAMCSSQQMKSFATWASHTPSLSTQSLAKSTWCPRPGVAVAYAYKRCCGVVVRGQAMGLMFPGFKPHLCFLSDVRYQASSLTLYALSSKCPR